MKRGGKRTANECEEAARNKQRKCEQKRKRLRGKDSKRKQEKQKESKKETKKGRNKGRNEQRKIEERKLRLAVALSRKSVLRCVIISYIRLCYWEGALTCYAMLYCAMSY